MTHSKRNAPIGWSLAAGLYLISHLISMAAMSIGAAIFFLLPLLHIRKLSVIGDRIRLLSQEKAVRLLAFSTGILTLCLGASLAQSKLWPHPFATELPHLSYVQPWVKSWYFALPFLWVLMLNSLSLQQRDRLIRLWLMAFGIIACIGIAQHFTGWPRPRAIPDVHPQRFHTQGWLGFHLSAASIFVFPFFVALDHAWSLKTKKGFHFFLFLAIAILGGIALVLTYSRILWVALPVGLIVWFFLKIPKKWALGILALGILLGALATQHPSIRARIHSPMGISERYRIWDAHWHLFLDRPILGVGWRLGEAYGGVYLEHKLQSKTVFSGHAHNNWIDLLSGTGMMGTLAWLFWMSVIVWRLLALTRSGATPYGHGLLCGWLIFQINGFTQVNLWDAKVMHTMMWIAGFSMVAWYPPLDPHRRK